MDKDEILEMIRLAKAQRVKKLSLSNRGITELPPEIGTLGFVKSIDLSYNQLKNLPDEFFLLRNLNTIYLNHNEIEDINSEVGKLINMRVLDLSHNKLNTLPGEIGKLVNLTQLDVSYNEIKSLPLELINLTSLKKLYLDNNPCEFPPQKVIKRGLYATMHYLFGELRKKETAKVIIQVYNMPRDISKPFEQYVECFNDIISSYKKHDLNFDVKFIKQDFSVDMDVNLEMETYLLDFMSFIKTNINTSTDKTGPKDISKVFDVQVVELRSQLDNLNKMLEDKVIDIKELQARIDNLSKIIDKK